MSKNCTKIKIIQMEYKHDIKSGCEVVFLENRPPNSKTFFRVFLCKTHTKEICRCGVEWGKHDNYNQYLKTL